MRISGPWVFKQVEKAVGCINCFWWNHQRPHLVLPAPLPPIQLGCSYQGESFQSIRWSVTSWLIIHDKKWRLRKVIMPSKLFSLPLPCSHLHKMLYLNH
jgi:hypothetical protein